MTPNSTGPDHLPVYESLIRERGDAVAEARVAAEQMKHQAPPDNVTHHEVPQEPGPQ